MFIILVLSLMVQIVFGNNSVFFLIKDRIVLFFV